MLTKLLALALLATFVATKPRLGFGGSLQDWGFVEVRPGAHMFYWLYYTTAKVTRFDERPLIVYFQGGPGGSSTGMGNFMELGPFDEYLKPRKHTWVQRYNILYVDNPVGCGFGYVESDDLLARSNLQIALDVVALLKYFYQSSPELENAPVYLVGNSYAGKMVPEIAVELEKEIRKGGVKANFKGLAIGNPSVNSFDVLESQAEFLDQLGYLDEKGFERIEREAKQARVFAEAERWQESFDAFFNLTYSSIAEETGGVNVYHVTIPFPYYPRPSRRRLLRYQEEEEGGAERIQRLENLMNGPVKQALGLPANRTWFYFGEAASVALQPDFMKPVDHLVAHILEETDLKFVLFSGTLDLIILTPGTMKWVDRLAWHGREEYRNLRRQALVVDGIVEGYSKQHENLAVYWVLRSGHSVIPENVKASDAIFRELTGY